MSFLTRSSQPTSNQPDVPEFPSVVQSSQTPAVTLEGLFFDDNGLRYPSSDSSNLGGHDFEVDDGGITSSSLKFESPVMEGHMDVSEDEGWITIPYKELPDKWEEASNLSFFGSLDRPFVFPGEQLHILACLPCSNKDAEIITPFKVAAMISKNGTGWRGKNEDGCSQPGCTLSGDGDLKISSQTADLDRKDALLEKIDLPEDVSVSESVIRMEDHRRKTEALLQKLRNSHFFVRIAEVDESDWRTRNNHMTSSERSTTDTNSIEKSGNGGNIFPPNAVVDRGSFSTNFSGARARMIKCCSLSNGDIMVLLQVNIGIDIFSDAVLEIIQLEKFQDRNITNHNQNVQGQVDDPCGDLLQWLLPLDNTVPSSRPFSPPPLGSSSAVGSASQRTNLSTSGSQLFSFGHFRSYSMSSLPQIATLSSSSFTSPNPRTRVDLEDWDQFSSQRLATGQSGESDQLLSFRGIRLEPERFMVQCGLEGIYIPGKRWRRKIEIIQPVEIYTFSADCNTDDILCVQVKNVVSEHLSDIVILIDSISIVYDESSKGVHPVALPVALPVACIEAGDAYSLPNLPLRRGEEHSFIVKLSTSIDKMNNTGQTLEHSHIHHGNGGSNAFLSKTSEGRAFDGGYAVVVSYRSNFTESRLLFKKATSWRPRKTRDLMVSIMSDISRQPVCSDSVGISELPLQVLTLQATNLTDEDLTLTVLAPASATSPPSVVSLNSSPSSPVSAFVGFPETVLHHHLGPPRDIGVGTKNQFQNTEFCCTHLWLQSRVPLGCVPSRSTTTIELELLPLTDGIITLDTLQIEVKEKGLTYFPEHSLMINATSSISSGLA